MLAFVFSLLLLFALLLLLLLLLFTYKLNRLDGVYVTDLRLPYVIVHIYHSVDGNHSKGHVAHTGK